ncbi:MAG: hypothetical protein H6740_28935 [Alphaproteobacteria bacterium]|nr:hypothetical protein [Alphaproteobacteria bacterium]
MRLLPLLLLSACAYDVEAWWTDLAQAHCDCQYPDEVRRDCVAEQMAAYQGAPEWEACHDDPAPVSRKAVQAWIQDYTDTCRVPAAPAPTPEDPNWSASCE